MNPIHVIILPSQSGSPPLVGLNLIGALFWCVTLFLSWSSHGWFDHWAGKLIFIPAVFLTGIVGYFTTGFLLIVTLLGCLCGWIFDFSFLHYIGKAFSWFFNLIIA
jgi:hypothetical protein